MTNKGGLTEGDKAVYIYLRYALLIGPVIICSFFISEFFFDRVSVVGKTIQNTLFLLIAPGYFILPGIFKVVNGKKMGLFELQLFIGFTVITLGIGPSIIFFKKYDPIIKKLIKK